MWILTSLFLQCKDISPYDVGDSIMHLYIREKGSQAESLGSVSGIVKLHLPPAHYYACHTLKFSLDTVLVDIFTVDFQVICTAELMF